MHPQLHVYKYSRYKYNVLIELYMIKNTKNDNMKGRE